jgi:phosphate transporter
VASVVIMPLVVDVALSSSSLVHARVMCFTVCLSCSAAMSSPVTSFPNCNALLAEDDFGLPYLKPRDFFVWGSAVSIITILIVTSAGYWLASVVFATIY